MDKTYGEEARWSTVPAEVPAKPTPTANNEVSHHAAVKSSSQMPRSHGAEAYTAEHSEATESQEIIKYLLF